MTWQSSRGYITFPFLEALSVDKFCVKFDGDEIYKLTRLIKDVFKARVKTFTYVRQNIPVSRKGPEPWC